MLEELLKEYEKAYKKESDAIDLAIAWVASDIDNYSGAYEVANEAAIALAKLRKAAK